MFGTDAAVNARLLKALQLLKLPGFNGAATQQNYASDTREWSLELNRLVAPEGSQRQTQVVIVWSRFPKESAGNGKCRKPKPVEIDIQLPRWMKTHSRARSTRRRVAAEFSRDLEETSGEIVMLYHNGYAHDEGVNHFSGGLEKAGFTHESGSGPQQRWSHPDGGSVIFSSLNSTHDMGCRIAGPVLSIQWRKPHSKT